MHTMSKFAETILNKRYAHQKGDRKETWPEVAQRVAYHVMGAVGARQLLVDRVAKAITECKFMPGGRYLAAAGRAYHQTQNCLLMRAEDSREGWASLLQKVTMASMTGAGLGVVYSDVRGKGTPLKRTGGMASGPIPLMLAVNEVGRAAQMGGDRRAALWAGLHWNHPQVFEFMRMKQWAPEIIAMKQRDFSAPAPMDHTNISIILDDDFFTAYRKGDERATKVYWQAIRLMCETGEPGFSVDVGENKGENLRNACTEITSSDDSDVCNIGSVNLARINTLGELRDMVELGTAFLIAGSVYSDLPYEKVHQMRNKNRRIGLGIMGIHEWLLMRGKSYAPDMELAEVLEVYRSASDMAAERYARGWGLATPVKKRAIAPNGTIGIVAETTTGIEPILCVATLRRYHDRGEWRQQYVIDPTAERLIAQGMEPDAIEDAYTLASDVERRVAMQAWVQRWVDHGISSTVNLPAWGAPHNNEHTFGGFGNMLLRYLPRLRGITVYPDGARDGQPLVRVPYSEATASIGVDTIAETKDVCELRGGSCG